MRVLAAPALLAATLPALAGAAVLERIEVTSDPAPVVRLTVSDPVSPAGRPLRPDGAVPARFYVDLPGTRIAPEARGIFPGSGVLLRVRSAQFDPTTARVVLDLAEAVPFSVRAVGRTITIAPESGPATAASPPPPARAPSPPPAAPPPAAPPPAP